MNLNVTLQLENSREFFSFGQDLHTYMYMYYTHPYTLCVSSIPQNKGCVGMYFFCPLSHQNENEEYVTIRLGTFTKLNSY